MPLYPEPHSEEWFSALEAIDPIQAAQTRQILKSAGRNDVCGVCGDAPATDLRLVTKGLPENALASIRLCDDCRKMRGSMYGETYAPLSE